MKECAYCHKTIESDDEYYIVGDNYLQVKYFDSEEDNIFCSKDCICSALSVLLVDTDGETYVV